MKNHKRITLDDIAKRVGITKMTVSRFLKDPKLVASETGEKIQAIIDEIGYVPNRAPVMLSKASSHTIGLAVSSFSNLLFSDLIEGVEDCARNHGYEVLITHTSYSQEEAERKILQLLSYQVDALILTDPVYSVSTIKRLHSTHVPVMELMSLKDVPIDMNIGYDHAKAAYAAVKGLIQAGRKNIGYLRARLDPRTLDRQRGYELACKQAGLPTYIFGSEAHSNFSRGSDMMRNALHDTPQLDAIFTTNDDVAIGAMIACIEMGIKVPEQIAVLGYNGLNIGTATSPKLSSIITSRYEMGYLAVEQIMKRLKDEKHDNRIELYPMISYGETLLENERKLISRNFDKLFALNINI